jgi:hypothetical protein
MNDELNRMSKVGDNRYFKVLPQHSPGGLTKFVENIGQDNRYFYLDSK